MKLETKLRIAYLCIALIPLALVFGMTRDSPVYYDKYYHQAMAAAVAVAILLGLASPWFTGGWLLCNQLNMVRAFCARVRNGNYRHALPVPNEQSDGDDENEVIALMRDMNWMARQIASREQELQQSIAELNQSRQQISRQKSVLEQANNELIETQISLKQRTTELEQACQNMQVMAMTDPLTKIANRRWFFHELEREFFALTQNREPLSLLILDIDHFKRVNDQYGHQNGDRVLVDLAAIVRRVVRTIDLVARIGGEEFAVLLPGTDGKGAQRTARKIQQAIAGAVFALTDRQQIKITVSIGMCSLARPPFPTLDSFYNFADQALYQSKDSGRDAICVYDPQAAAVCRLDRSKERGGNGLCHRNPFC